MKSIAKGIVYAMLSLFFVFGCTTNKPAKIGFLIHSLENERWENDMNYFKNKVEELHGSVLVEVADNDSEKQLKQAKKLIMEGVDVLVVIPVDQFAAADIVQIANAKNIKVISYDRLIKNCKIDYYVSTDNVEIGELQAKYLTAIKPKGKYALIGGSVNDNNSKFLYLGQMNILAPLVEKGDVDIVYNELTKDWKEQEGYDHAKKMLGKTKGNIDAIIAGNDAIASGVMRALAETGKMGKVLLAGMDADLYNLQEIVKGNQTCTIYKPYEKLASTAAMLAIKLANCEECENTFETVSNGEMLVPSVLHEAMVVNKENLKLTVISEGYQVEEEVYK